MSQTNTDSDVLTRYYTNMEAGEKGIVSMWDNTALGVDSCG